MNSLSSFGARRLGPVSLAEIDARGFTPDVMPALLQRAKKRMQETSEDLSCVISFISQDDEMTPERVVRAAKYIAAHPEILQVAPEKKDEAEARNEA